MSVDTADVEIRVSIGWSRIVSGMNKDGGLLVFDDLNFIGRVHRSCLEEMLFVAIGSVLRRENARLGFCLRAGRLCNRSGAHPEVVSGSKHCCFVTVEMLLGQEQT